MNKAEYVSRKVMDKYIARCNRRIGRLQDRTADLQLRLKMMEEIISAAVAQGIL